MLFYNLLMEIPQRKTLPHEIPSWIDPQKEIYFITINCKERGRNQLARPEIAEQLFETVRHRQERFFWWPHVFLLMPDHLHALLSFPPSRETSRIVVNKWKEWSAKSVGIVWQRDFFEHRLRSDENRREKADYILQNPLRRGLVKKPEEWPFVYFADSQISQFAR
jgi:REP element-mobilizing transposase RayT